MMYKYCSLAIALFAGAANANPFAAKTSPSNAKAAYHAGLMKNAVPTKNSQIRQLDQLEGDDNNNALMFKRTDLRYASALQKDIPEFRPRVILANIGLHLLHIKNFRERKNHVPQNHVPQWVGNIFGA